jgi:hypothetical protein
MPVLLQKHLQEVDVVAAFVLGVGGAITACKPVVCLNLPCSKLKRLKTPGMPVFWQCASSSRCVYVRFP